MGPRRWCRGKAVPVRRRTIDGVACFNGAATMVSRKAGLRRQMRSTLLSMRFNGAATMVSRKSCASADRPAHAATALQWGRDDGVAEKAAQREAGQPAPTLQLQWGRDDGVAEKCLQSRSTACATSQASMGPRRWCRGKEWLRSKADTAILRLQWGRDDGVAEKARLGGPGEIRSARLQWGRDEVSRKRSPGVCSCKATAGFNGAATMCRGKQALHVLSAAEPTELQWGRDDVSRKGRQRFTICEWFHSASMGPRRWCRGKMRVTAMANLCHRWLQWGRDDGVAEKQRLRRAWYRVQICFNGAATMVSRKDRCTLDGWRVQAAGFNGAATMVSRKATPRES